MSKQFFQVRPASIQDARTIATMHIEAWRKAYAGIVPTEYLDSLSADVREPGWARMIEVGKPSLWVAECEGRVVAIYVDAVL